MSKVRRLRRWNSVKGCRAWLRTSAKNRANDWYQSWLEWRKWRTVIEIDPV